MGRMAFMKLLVTHRSPDLDAIGSLWILKRFDAQHYADAKLAFVNAGDTMDLRAAADMGFSQENITHVDTGLGEFDHHQPERGLLRICATSLVYDYVCALHPDLKEDKALAYLVEYVTAVDHFEEHSWPDSNNLRYQLLLHNLIDGADAVTQDDEATVLFGFTCLDAGYSVLSAQIEAEEEIEEKGFQFKTPWGKGLAIESSNDEVIKVAQKSGYMVAVRKDPEVGNIRIKAVPRKGIDLTDIANKVKEKDGEGYWYFHPGKTMLLNGSSKDPNRKPSSLTLKDIIAIFESS